MVRKIKVVDVVANEEAAPIEQAPIEASVDTPPEVPVEMPVEVPVEVPVEMSVEKPVEKPVEATPDEEKKDKPASKQLSPDKYITCETCNKNMLMKTYKHTHQKLCLNKHAPPPPPPPPPPVAPEPKAKKARPPPKEKNVVEETPKPDFNGTVSFDFTPVDPYVAMREQRVIMRQQRVKSLISQAI